MTGQDEFPARDQTGKNLGDIKKYFNGTIERRKVLNCLIASYPNRLSKAQINESSHVSKPSVKIIIDQMEKKLKIVDIRYLISETPPKNEKEREEWQKSKRTDFLLKNDLSIFYAISQIVIENYSISDKSGNLIRMNFLETEYAKQILDDDFNLLYLIVNNFSELLTMDKEYQEFWQKIKENHQGPNVEKFTQILAIYYKWFIKGKAGKELYDTKEKIMKFGMEPEVFDNIRSSFIENFQLLDEEGNLIDSEKRNIRDMLVEFSKLLFPKGLANDLLWAIKKSPSAFIVLCLGTVLRFKMKGIARIGVSSLTKDDSPIVVDGRQIPEQLEAPIKQLRKEVASIILICIARDVTVGYFKRSDVSKLNSFFEKLVKV